MKNNFYCDYHHEVEIGDSIEVRLYNGEYVSICEEAYENHALFCVCCDEVYFDTEDYSMEDNYCPYCYEDRENDSIIEDYHSSHNRELEFWGNPSNNVYFGLEIESEICDGSNRTLLESAKNVKDSIGNYFTLEHDGSLDVGFETISSPMSYEFIENNDILEDICYSLSVNNMVAKNSCGVHIHVSATDEVNEKIGDILYFIENNKKDVIAFSGRNTNKFERWSNFYTYGDTVDRLAVYSSIVRDCERYRVVNLNNSDTIEFRLFNGTLESHILKGYLQFASILTEFDIQKISNFSDLYSYAKEIGYTCLANLIDKRVLNK